MLPPTAPSRASLLLPALLALAGCEAAHGPTPRIDAVTPDVACDAGAPVTVTITGAGFAPAPTQVLTEPTLALPTLTLTRAGDLTGADDGGASTLHLAPSDGTLRWIDEGTLSFDASPAVGLVPGAWDLEVSNPDAAASNATAPFFWADLPAAIGIDPAEVCIESSEAPLVITGEGFLFLDGAGPVVTVAGGTYAASPGDCAPLAGDRAGEVCTSIAVTVDASALPLGDVALTVTNPAPAACATVAPASFAVRLPPTLAAVEPSMTCAGSGVFRVTGDNLPADPVVTVGGVPAASVTVIDAQTIEVVAAADTPEGVVDIVVAGVSGCEASVTVEIVGEPDVFFVDPPALYEGMSVQVTAWLADVTAEVTEVWLTDASGARIDLAFAWDASDPDRVVATVPADLAAGSYGFGFLEADGCGAALDDALVVTDTLTVAVDRLEPAYAWTYDHTPVQVFAKDPVPAGQVGFVETPRLYLTPVGGGTTASAIEGTSFRDDGLLTATIPPGLVPGVYDVLVVNPDATVGVLNGGLTVTEAQPPEITSVSPPGLENSTNETVHIRGVAFADPSVTLTCREGGTERIVDATVLSWTYTSIDAVVPSSEFNEAICVVEVTNAAGPSARWAALSVRNPAENLFPWSAGPDLVEARRAPVAVAGRTSAVDRWVYAIGGDSGASDGALTSIEVAPVGVYGDVGAWSVLPGGLPAPVTLAGGAMVGEFVYVVGGNDGTGPVATAWRAHVLDPMNVPRFDHLSIDDEGTLDGGEWTWRVAALFAADDVANPGGESLPGDPVTVALPDVGGLAVEVAWEPVPRAIGYRVYRSATADTSGAEEWVGDTTDTWLRDDGLPTDPTRTPLPDGALGEWTALPALIQAREAACVAFAPDPAPDPVIVHLYAAGGRAPDGTPLDTVEVLPITIAASDEHHTSAWADAGVRLSDARWGCGAWTVDAERHSVVDAGETWVYFAGGDTGGRVVGTVDAGRVGHGGSLEAWQEITSMSPGRAGHATASASDFLYAFGGQGGSPSDSGKSGELGYDPLPDVRNWNSLAESMAVPRVWASAAQESAVIVVVGGQTNTEAATRSTDVTNW